MSETIKILQDWIIQNVQSEIILGITLISLILLTYLLITFNEKFAEKIKLLRKKKKMVKKDHKLIDYHIIEEINKINEDLAVLRNELNADRAYIIEFHNGGEFFSNKPRFRMSLTYEKVKSGISQEYHKLQNIDVTTHWDYLKYLFSREEHIELPPGVTEVIKNPYCRLKDNIHHTPKRVYLVETLSMSSNNVFDRKLAQDKHIYYMLQTPILNSSGNVLGVVNLDYTDIVDKEKILDKPDFNPCELCRFATRLAVLWETNPKEKTKLMKYQQEYWENL